MDAPRTEPTHPPAPRPRQHGRPPLTATEVGVLRMLRDGRPAVAAAHDLDLTLGAVARTTTALRTRYGTGSTVAALTRAHDDGLI